MKYTTDQARQRAQEVGAFMEVLFAGRHDNVVLTESELTALCNAVQKQTLLEAADEFQTESRYGFADTIEFLRRMAEGE